MTWAEFRIRQFAYRRMDRNEWYKVREIAYSALIGSHVDPKKLPKNKDKFMKLDNRQAKATEKAKERMREVAEIYRLQKQKNGG